MIVGDSAFASVVTAAACLKYGLHFIGIVKTATKGYPKAAFDAWEATTPGRGKSTFATTTVKVDEREHTLLACDWMVKQGKKIISTFSNGNETDPQRIAYTKVVEQNGLRMGEKRFKVTNRPTVVKELFRSFSCIDVHDHYRQGILGFERHWQTNC